jgi:Flp pilus assembly protein TadB
MLWSCSSTCRDLAVLDIVAILAAIEAFHLVYRTCIALSVARTLQGLAAWALEGPNRALAAAVGVGDALSVLGAELMREFALELHCH